MAIKIEELSQKHRINFYFPQPLANGYFAILATKDNVSEYPLAKNIMDIDGIEYCLVTESLLAICYSSSADLDTIKALVLAEIDDFLSDEKLNKANLPTSSQTSMALIEAVADAFIRPTLNRDNGDIKIHYLKNGVLSLSFTGRCAGCPYAQNTLNNVIIKTLQRYVPEVQEVSLGNQV